MAHEIQYAKGPRWSNAEKTMIDLIVKFSHLDDEVPFTAALEDVEPHGRELFIKARNGLYGTVGDFVPPPAPVASIPTAIQMRQFRLELLNRNLLESVQPAINSITDDVNRQRVQIEWDYSTAINRNAGWFNQIATAMGLSTQDLDSIFVEASKR